MGWLSVFFRALLGMPSVFRVRLVGCVRPVPGCEFCDHCGKGDRHQPVPKLLRRFFYSALASARFLALYLFLYPLIRSEWSLHINVLSSDTLSSQSRQILSSLRF